jgi:CRISPR-associated protein Cas1
MNFDGALISTILHATPLKADLRIAQVDASRDSEKKFTIAEAIVGAKISRSFQVLDWLSDRYDIVRDTRVARLERSKLKNARTVTELRIVEGRVAQRYWEAYGKVLPSHLEFRGRTGKHNMNASDVTNASLNFGYGLLQAQCTRAVKCLGAMLPCEDTTLTIS